MLHSTLFVLLLIFFHVVYVLCCTNRLYHILVLQVMVGQICLCAFSGENNSMR